VIRFSAFLVVAAVGTLVAGVVTSKLLLVYIAIGVSGLALLALGVGAAVHWRELTGKPGAAPVPAPAPAVVPRQAATPEPATAAAASAATGVASTATATAASRPPWSGTVPAGSSRPEYLPPAATRPPAPSEWKWRDEPAPRETAAEKPAASLAGQRDRTVAGDQPSAPDDDRSVQDQTMIFRAQPDQTMIFRAQPAAVAEEPATRTPGEPRARTSAEPAPAAHAPASDVTAAPEDTAAAADTARESASQESESTAAESTAAESAPPASDPEPAADTPAATSAPASGSAPTSGSASDDDAPSNADGQADPAPATEPEPEPADEATTITKAVAPASGAASDLEVTEVTVVPGVPRYHRASCILIRFMGDSDLDKMTVAAAKEAGCTPCRACLPDQPEESPE
jgi:hypothetical protein